MREGCSEASRRVTCLKGALSLIPCRKSWVPSRLVRWRGAGWGHFQIPWLHRGCGRQASRGASGVSWPKDQCGWMAWDEDHLAESFRHFSAEVEADGV